MTRLFRCGNCIDCGTYSRLNQERRCQDCAEVERGLINSAMDSLRADPDLTLDELAEALDISECQVMDWIKKGYIRCTVIQFDCPTCGTDNRNRFTCARCGYEYYAATKPPIPPIRPPRRMAVDRERPKRTPRSEFQSRLRRRNVYVT